MVVRKKAGALSPEEKHIAKALLARKWRNQDIQDLLNRGRAATINSARITEVKRMNVTAASDRELEFFIAKKKAWDARTGLNLFDDERLLRAREAMCLAVHVFNSPTTHFKSEMFSVLANIAWTYLMHEFYVRKGVTIADATGYSPSLSKLLKRSDCPLSHGIKQNLDDLKQIRDTVEHRLLGRSDPTWFTLFQACCLNFDKVLCELFGEHLSLKAELSFALQFAKLNIDQIAMVEQYAVPQHIEALDARLRSSRTEEELADLEYRFQVVYTLDSATKGQANIRFLVPGSDEAEAIRNILVKHKPADEIYPHKPGRVCELVAQRSGKRFTGHNHTQAWRKFKVRPKPGAAKPGATNRDYCIYHAAHRDYTYNDAWVQFLIEKISSDEGFAEIRSVAM